MTLWDLLCNGPCVEGRIQISCFHTDEYDREVYYEGDAEYFYPNKFEKLMNREVAYMFPNTTLSVERKVVPIICIELSEEE